MRTITALKLRNRLGEVLDQVRFTKTPVLVYKNEKPVVKILPVDEQRVPKGFDLKEYRRIMSTLPKKYQIGDPDPEFLATIGAGAQVSLEEEEDVITEYLKQKHGAKTITGR